MNRRNQESSSCEIRKVQQGPSGGATTLEIVAVVRGTDQAASAVDRFERHLTEEEKQAGIGFYWEYAPGIRKQSWPKVHPHRAGRAKPERCKRR
jgi:hypothetical protein